MSVNSSHATSSPRFQCSDNDIYISIYIVFGIVKVLFIVPLCVFILHHAVLQWRRSVRKQSHSDVFTYHLVVMNVIWFLGFVCFLWGYYSSVPALLKAEISLSTINLYGELFLHIMTCVERYLAAVHSITYRGVNIAHGVAIRNVSIFFVWILTGVVMVLNVTENFNQAVLPFFVVLPFSIVVVSFCSLSVLWVLIRPGPGERGGAQKRVDLSKKRAFHTIMSILSVLWIWLIGLLAVVFLQQLKTVEEFIGCVLDSTVCFFSLPSSLVLPLLYLHRSRKRACLS